MIERHEIDGLVYTLCQEQGIVLRQNGSLAADFEGGRWTWTNPNLDLPERHLEALLGPARAFAARIAM